MGLSQMNVDWEHGIQYLNTIIFGTKAKYMYQIIMELTEIEFYPYNIYRGSLLSQQIMEASYLCPKNCHDMTLDPLCYASHTLSIALAPRAFRTPRLRPLIL
jgi:hypothetical protein